MVAQLLLGVVVIERSKRHQPSSLIGFSELAVDEEFDDRVTTQYFPHLHNKTVKSPWHA